MLRAPEPVKAQTFIRSFPTASAPVVFRCSDGANWTVKAQFAGRGVAADSALLSLGRSIGAPVPPVGLVEVSTELVDAETHLHDVQSRGRFEPGVWHATKWIDGIHAVDNKREDGVRLGAGNEDRYGLLALFFAWCSAGDRQFLYEDDPPYLVHVVDMGHALPGANGWTKETLDAHAAPVVIPADLWKASGLDRARAERVISSLAPAEVITQAVALPKAHWGSIGMDERISLAHYLSRQFHALTAALSTL